jgi:hypothetical protein
LRLGYREELTFTSQPLAFPKLLTYVSPCYVLREKVVLYTIGGKVKLMALWGVAKQHKTGWARSLKTNNSE